MWGNFWKIWTNPRAFILITFILEPENGDNVSTSLYIINWIRSKSKTCLQYKMDIISTIIKKDSFKWNKLLNNLIIFTEVSFDGFIFVYIFYALIINT